MRLLFATSIIPRNPPASGYEIATQAVIDSLRRNGAEVTLAGFAWPGGRTAVPEGSIVLGEADLRTEAAAWPERVRWLARAVLSGTTFASAKLRALTSRRLRAVLSEAGSFDGVVLNSFQLAGAFEEVFLEWPGIYVAHNVEHRSAEQNAESLSGYRALLYRREARLLRALEARLCAQASFVFTLAEEDRASLGLSRARSAALPLVVSPAAPRLPRPRKPVHDAALIGTWTWHPNRIGLNWFLGEVVPHLPPGLDIRIAGDLPRDMPAPPAGVTMVGRVPDATEFLRSAKVVPLVSRAGTGLQLKSIEAFELGLPSVATSLSLRGIGQVPENCAVADDPRAFAAALVEAVSAKASDLDGRRFHDAQSRALDEAVRLGLGGFRASRVLAA